MKKKNSKVSVFDLQGLFCGWLDRKLQGGELTRCFIADMVKRGVLSDEDETILVAARQQIDFMVHGDKDYFKHHIALKRKETTMNSVYLLNKMLAKEDAERQRESVNENERGYVTKKGCLCMDCFTGGDCHKCLELEKD